MGHIPKGQPRVAPVTPRATATAAIGDVSHMTTLQLTLALPAPQATQLIENMTRLARGERNRQLREGWAGSGERGL